jgi:hypothetical protein
MRFHPNGSVPPNDGDDWIFVFGSNLSGIHGAGAAKAARELYGAKLRVAEGPTGRSYAIPTKDEFFNPLPLDHIKISVDELEMFILDQDNAQKNFWITALGTGLAGYTHEQIAPLFKDFPRSGVSFPDVWKPWLTL